MARVFLHVGAPKTGTTYVQGRLWRNHKALAEHGVLFPNSPGAHFRAAQDLRGQRFRGHDDPRVAGAWDRLTRHARDWRGEVVVVSHEILSGCEPGEARRAVESLRPHEVHVVYTARDLARQIPAMWQESVKNGRKVSYDDYLRTLQSEHPHLVGRIFWRMQDAVDVLGRWGAAVPEERIHVVTVPAARARADRDELWSRFCAAVGVDPAVAPLLPEAGDNVSLGLVEAELLRRLNVRLEGSLGWPDHARLLKGFLTRDVLQRGAAAPPTRLPAADRPWVAERSTALVEGLRARRYDVAGSLDDLLVESHDDGDAEARPETGEVLDAAVDALALVLTGEVRPPSRLDRRVSRLRRLLSRR
jgi:hypothetical protein